MNEIGVTIAGTVVQEVRVHTTKSGQKVATFRLASNSRRFNRAQGVWEDGETTYLTVNCWRNMADHIEASINRGDPVVVTGRLRVRTWATEEKSGTSVEVDASAVGHDLSRGVSAFTRQPRAAQVAPADPPPEVLEADAEAMEDDEQEPPLATAV